KSLHVHALRRRNGHLPLPQPRALVGRPLRRSAQRSTAGGGGSEHAEADRRRGHAGDHAGGTGIRTTGSAPLNLGLVSDSTPAAETGGSDPAITEAAVTGAKDAALAAIAAASSLGELKAVRA